MTYESQFSRQQLESAFRLYRLKRLVSGCIKEPGTSLLIALLSH
jgi:hypothetical protein